MDLFVYTHWSIRSLHPLIGQNTLRTAPNWTRPLLSTWNQNDLSISDQFLCSWTSQRKKLHRIKRNLHHMPHLGGKGPIIIGCRLWENMMTEFFRIRWTELNCEVRLQQKWGHHVFPLKVYNIFINIYLQFHLETKNYSIFNIFFTDFTK
jgi:hypothetical protein